MQERFEELKAKRVWLHGTEEEKAEYNSLKEQFKTLDTTSDFEEREQEVPTPVQTVPRETITMTRQELEDLIDSKVQTLKAENSALLLRTNELRTEKGLSEWKEFKDSEERKHTAWLKLYRSESMSEAGAIVGWREHKVNRDAKGYVLSTDYEIDVLYSDGVKKHVIPLVQLGSITEREEVELSDMKKKKVVKIHGKVRRSSVNKEGYTMSANIIDGGIDGQKDNDWVELREIRDDITFTIKRPSGQTHTMPAKYLNS